MAITSYTGVLHTNSEKYYSDFSVPTLKNINSQKRQLDQLKENERQFYAAFGCSSYESFIAKIRELFNGAEAKQDQRVYRFFSNDIITNWIWSQDSRSLATNLQPNLQLKIHYVQDPGQLDLKSIFPNVDKNFSWSFDSQDLIIEFGTDLEDIKENVNKYLKYYFNKSGEKKQTGTLYSTDSDSIRDLQLWFQNPGKMLTYFQKYFSGVLNKGARIQIAGPAGLTKRVTGEFNVQSSLFKYRADDFKRAQTDKKLAANIARTRTRLFKTIMQDSGANFASQEMQTAIKNVWDMNVGKKLSDFALFEKNGAVSALQGAFGEFQSALLGEYVRLRLNTQGLPSYMGGIISDTLKEGEQDKSDVFYDIGRGAGVQVKNYGSNSQRQIKVNIHPDAFTATSAFAESGVSTTNFLDSMANYFFNATYQSTNAGAMAAFEREVLPTYLAEIASMDVNQTWDDKVTFYQISGKYFIPASVFLEQQITLLSMGFSAGSAEVSIDGPETVGSDADFRALTGVGNFHGLTSGFPKGGEYWYYGHARGTLEPYFEPLSPGKNESTYKSLISKNISFRAVINQFSLTLSNYSLF